VANSVLSIANFFLGKASEDAKPIDPLKLQKLIYIAHGWNLAFTGEPLIRESFEAWKYGPVVPRLYLYFKDFRSGYITTKAETPQEDIPSVQCDIISQVWEKYRDLSPTFLSSMTHQPGSAWSRVYDHEFSGWNSSPEIPNALIRDEFLERLKSAGAADGA
jgi:uncharacterized phage-associated protein